MKKYLFLLTVLVLAACEGPMGPPGEPGTVTNWKILTYTVRADEWKLVGYAGELNSYYMCEKPARDITDFIYTDGNVTGYLIQNPRKQNEVQTPLPFVIPRGELDKGQEILYTEVYTFDFMPGSIAFYVNYTDFETNIRPGECDYRIVLTW